MNTKNERIISTKKYYGSLENMKMKYERNARKDAFTGNTIPAFEQWKEKSRKALWNLLGLHYMDSVPLNPIIEEEIMLPEGILRQKVLLQTEQDVWMPCYILIPQKSTQEKLPVFLAPPGHQGAGKYSVAGRTDIPAVADAIAKFNYDYGLQLARLGYVALCPDCRGFGERRDEYLQNDDENSFLRSSCFQLAHMAEPLGETVAGMCVWDLMRLLDYVETKSEWDSSTISCLGFSGGGMQTLYLSALDDRIRTICISGYFYGFRDSLLLLNNNCSCNYIPHLWEHFDMGDIASLIAPRPLMIQSCREDHLNGPRGLENVYEQLHIVMSAYRLYDAESKIVHDIQDGGHCWHDNNLKSTLEYFYSN